ncbi:MULTISPECIES: hypothetical protein [Bacteroidales]|uniref:hypothetical protein n=1 Tax=Bacteroidales TaxID=171549 RepID=UPI001F33D681|nr:hypothetical protein [Bacteroides ovatus]
MDKKMIQRWIHAIMVMAAIAVLLVSCRQDEWFEPSPVAREGYVALRFSADIPAMEKVATRAVDPDGGGVQDMTLFCFDSYGLFITTVTAKNIKQSSVSTGTFQAEVPENTRTVHFVANQVMTEFQQDHFRNKSEAEVMALLEGSSGRMIYWARFACDNSTEEMKKKSIAEQMTSAGNNIKMLRNHAKVSVLQPTDNGYFTVTGFAVYNTNAFGTVAPFHPEKGFNFTEDDWKANDFVTLPVNDAKLSDVTDVTKNMGQYIFESENSADDPVSIILYGHNEGDAENLYYRVMLVNDAGDQILIRRNHDYQLNITGKLSFGQATFAEALEAAATNNVWISISDKVNEVEDNDYILTVDQTDYVLDSELADGTYTLSYTIKGKDGMAITSADKAEVTWIDNNVARQGIENNFDISSGVGEGTISISLLPMGANEKLEGTLLVKHGRLQRKIKVILVKKQSFVPSWVGTQIYGNMNQSDPTEDRSHVTVMFTVPETTPVELFPLKVYISVGGLDIRNASGMELTVVRNGDKDWYSSGDITPEPDYKYLYVVEQPGVQRVYFENILSQQEGYTGTLHIEAEHFGTMERTFTYSSSRKSITVEGLKAYNAGGGGIEGYPVDELILYRLVPQKKNAHVQFDLQLRNKTGDDLDDDRSGVPFNAEPKDEFMLYSRYLDFYTDEEVDQAGVDRFDCLFYTEASDAWWWRNNPNGGRMLMFKPREDIINRPEGQTGKYSIYMKSNRPKSAEVIRIASNRTGIEAVLQDDALPDGTYAGNAYRSVTFELANYNPFRFGARLNYDNEGEQGREPDRVTNPNADVPELLTPLEWTYEPGKPVDIAIDITSFAGSDDNSVDPFGEEFEIYIDAPMLTLGNNSDLKEGKLYEASSGRFVYKVDADREEERKYFKNSEAINKDNTPDANVNQTGERKTLHFTTKSIVSAGDIVISSNEEQVVFYSKTFRVTNKSMGGNIYYTDELGKHQPVPAGAFVAFERVSNSSRIGAVTVTEEGKYELRLRKEYTFDWYTNPVQFHYELNGKVYHCTYESLSDLFGSQGNVVLTPATVPAPAP